LKLVKHVTFDMAAEFMDANQDRDVLADWLQSAHDENTQGKILKDFHALEASGCISCGQNTSDSVHCPCGLSDAECRIFEVEALEVEAMTAVQGHAKCKMQVALDSGAGDHVVGPDDIPNFAVEPSAGSKAGRGFIAADGNKIANLGQARVRVHDPKAQSTVRSVLQVADVSRPLYSVGKICDSGAEVTFTSALALVKDKKGKVLARFKREGGLYLADLEVTDQGGQPGFTRQGAGA
jgi:hypothetical protein